MKKITALLVLICMMLPQFAFAQTSSEAVSDEWQKNVEMLKTLGIIDYDETNIEQKISRAEFAVCFAKALNLKSASKDKLYYNDISNVHYAYDEITALTEYGYFAGTGGGKFEPEGSVTTEQLKILALKAMGFKNIALDNTEYVRFTENLIRQSEVLKGVSANGGLDYKNMVVFLSNLLKAQYYNVGGIDGNGNIDYVLDDRSVLFVTREMRYEKNLFVWAASGTAVDGSKYDKDVVCIGDLKLKSKDIDAYKYLGYYTDFIYSEAEDEKNLVWIEKSLSNEVLEIGIENECSYNEGKNSLTYYVGGKTKTAGLSDKVSIIYNGEFFVGRPAQAFEDERFKVRLAKVDKSSTYNVAIVEAYQNYVVSSKDSSRNSVYLEDVAGELSFVESDWEVLKIYNSAGELVSSDNVAAGDVLSIFKSKNGGYAMIYISKNTQSGTVDAITKDGDETIYTVLEKQYKLYNKADAEKITAGADVELLLDYNGYIADFDVSYKTNQNVGLLMNAAQESGMDAKPIFKIMTTSGDIKIMRGADKLFVDDVKYNNAKDVVNLFKSGSGFDTQVIYFNLNSKEEVTKIYTGAADDGTAKPLILAGEISSDITDKWKGGFYAAAQGKLGLKMLANASTVVFYYPKDASGADDEDYSVASLVDEDNYIGAKGYKTSVDGKYAEYVAVPKKMTYTVKNATAIYLVDSVISKLNKKQEVVDALVLCSENGEVTFEESNYVDISSYGLKKGDAVQVIAKDGQLMALSVLYRAGSIDRVANSLEWPHNEGRTISGYANERSGNVLKLGYTDASNFDEIFNIPSTKAALVYDSERDKVYKGTLEECLTYKNSDSSASKVIIQSTWSVINKVIIYR